MFYSIEEVQEKLGCSSEEIRNMVEKGELREFRDGAKIMFKVDDIDNMAPDDLAIAEEAESEISLSAADAEEDMDLTPLDTGSQIGLAPLDTGSQMGLMDSGGATGMSAGDSADHISLDDTSEGKDKDDTVITTHGVDVFDESDSDMEAVDPLAQTQIAPDIADQIPLDNESSGSGLLDLSREADDTSLGIELLEEIYPGAEEGGGDDQGPSQLEIPEEPKVASAAMDAPASPVPAFAAQMAQTYDPTSGAFGAMLIVPFIFIIYMACVIAAGVGGVQPALLSSISQYNFYVMIGGIILALMICAIGSMVALQSGQPAGPKTKKAKQNKPKVKKEKKPKKAKKAKK